jgi:hypothetical protein
MSVRIPSAPKSVLSLAIENLAICIAKKSLNAAIHASVSVAKLVPPFAVSANPMIIPSRSILALSRTKAHVSLSWNAVTSSRSRVLTIG